MILGMSESFSPLYSTDIKLSKVEEIFINYMKGVSKVFG